MWAPGEDGAESEGERGSSSDDERDIQCEMLESQRVAAQQQLCDLEAVSSQLLKEMNVLELQFHIERSCRESAEALAVQVTKENKVLKRASQMTTMMPLIPELPESCSAVTSDPRADPPEAEETLLLENQAKIAELQVSVDGLLSEKMQLEQQVEDLTKEQVQFREQLALEVEEKEAVLRKMSKQNKTMNKINRVSQLVTEEFTDMSQKLELEQGLRQHAEVFAHQMLVQQEAAAARGESGGSEAGLRLQLQRALEDISNISTALGDIQRCYRDPVGPGEAAAPPELQDLREQLERSEEEKTSLEAQLAAANGRVTQLQEEVQRLREKMSREEEEKATPAPPPPPPPPPPPLPPPIPTAVTNPLDLLRRRRAEGRADPIKAAPLLDTRTRAVEEMMERIKRGIVLRPVEKTQEDDGSWKDQRSENRKSAILELKGILDDRKRQQLRRLPSRRGLGRHVVEAELLQVLHRRRRAMGENQDQTWDPRPGAARAPAAGGAPWAGESGAGAPVLRRLKQNREKRDSRIRASALMVTQDN